MLDGHVTLQLESIDRFYLNGYVPRLQTGGGLISFLSEHRRHPIASPVLLGQITQDYVARARAFAQYYLDDAEWGEAFLKVCTYAPWGLKLYLNGHEWLKRQLAKEGIGFEALDNGFLRCESPARLQALADALGPAPIQAFLAKWSERLPLPLTKEDREAGFDYALSIWQMEVSLTQVLDRPLAGRQFFEEVIRDNLDLGRPDRVQLIFPRKITRRTPGTFRTRVLQQGVHPSLHIEYKHFDLKQYFKEGRALRTEGTFRETRDFDLNRGVENLPALHELGRQINRRLLEVECIRVMQRNLPVVATPFLDYAREVGVSLGELQEMNARFLQQGKLRRFSAVLNHRKVGFSANAMGVWAVPAGNDAELDKIGEMMGSFRAVSHCYKRPTYPDWPYNIFTMVHGKSSEECEQVLKTLSEKTGVREYSALYSTKEYKKVRVRYFTRDEEEWEAAHA